MLHSCFLTEMSSFQGQHCTCYMEDPSQLKRHKDVRRSRGLGNVEGYTGRSRSLTRMKPQSTIDWLTQLYTANFLVIKILF